MIENIHQIETIAGQMNGQTIDIQVIADLTNSLAGLESYVTDPNVIDLLNQLFSLLLQLETIIY